MATKKKKSASNSAKKKKIKAVLAILGVIILLIAGFLLGIYLKIFDANEMNEKYKLYSWPIIGEKFIVPTEDSATDKKNEKKTDTKKQSKPVQLTKEEIEKQTLQHQKEEKKRISKLARLYNEMKPDEAALILANLEDDMSIAIMQKMDESQVSQILASEEFGSEHAAEITRKMYAGVAKQVADKMQPQSAQN